ncbi:putative sodium/solute symporter, sodium/glucose symporter superfamily [Plasmopara halstedii]
MLASVVTYSVMATTLLLVALYAIIVSRRMEINTVTAFVSAKNSTSTLRLAWCLFSAGIGAGTLFAFPQIGVDAGSWGVIGYALSGVVGMLVLAFVGPYMRSALGENVTMTDVVSIRFGYIMQLYVGFIAMFYQFICLASEYTSIAQLTTMISPNARPMITILIVAFLTNLYLTIGGLRASLATDVWQGIGVVGLVAVVCIAMFLHVSIPDGAWSDTKVAAFTTSGFETLVTLNIAVTAASLFFTGFWQRVYAAYDNKTLRNASYIASCIIALFTVALAIAGMVSYLAYPDGDLFFAILIDMGQGWQVLIVVVIAMLSSGVSDSIQMGLVAELTTCFPNLSLLQARIICVLLNAPAIVIGYQQYDILTLYLIADLLCTAAVGPMLFGTWKRATRSGALAGSAAGLVTIFICGVIMQGKFLGGFNWFILPEGLYSQNSMITFIVTLIVPPVVTVVVSLMTKVKESQVAKDDSFLLESSPIQETVN